jgi:glycosyltransferase involved in cell wall biosynthesis
LQGRIEVVGFTDALADEYSRAAFIAFPSSLEGFPLAVLEAAGFGLGAVAQADLPGVRDIVKDGETGVVSGNDAESYASALAGMMKDVDYRRTLGENARGYCRERYSRGRILDMWESCLRALR